MWRSGEQYTLSKKGGRARQPFRNTVQRSSESIRTPCDCKEVIIRSERQRDDPVKTHTHSESRGNSSAGEKHSVKFQLKHTHQLKAGEVCQPVRNMVWWSSKSMRTFYEYKEVNGQSGTYCDSPVKVYARTEVGKIHQPVRSTVWCSGESIHTFCDCKEVISESETQCNAPGKGCAPTESRSSSAYQKHSVTLQWNHTHILWV